MPPEIALALPENVDEIRRNFKKPRLDSDYELSTGELDQEGVIRFLCGERGFREKSVRSTLERMVRAEAPGKQSNLERWD